MVEYAAEIIQIFEGEKIDCGYMTESGYFYLDEDSQYTGNWAHITMKSKKMDNLDFCYGSLYKLLYSYT